MVKNCEPQFACLMQGRWDITEDNHERCLRILMLLQINLENQPSIIEKPNFLVMYLATGVGVVRILNDLTDVTSMTENVIKGGSVQAIHKL